MGGAVVGVLNIRPPAPALLTSQLSRHNTCEVHSWVLPSDWTPLPMVSGLVKTIWKRFSPLGIWHAFRLHPNLSRLSHYNRGLVGVWGPPKLRHGSIVWFPWGWGGSYKFFMQVATFVVTRLTKLASCNFCWLEASQVICLNPTGIVLGFQQNVQKIAQMISGSPSTSSL